MSKGQEKPDLFLQRASSNFSAPKQLGYLKMLQPSQKGEEDLRSHFKHFMLNHDANLTDLPLDSDFRAALHIC